MMIKTDPCIFIEKKCIITIILRTKRTYYYYRHIISCYTYRQNSTATCLKIQMKLNKWNKLTNSWEDKEWIINKIYK